MSVPTVAGNGKALSRPTIVISTSAARRNLLSPGRFTPGIVPCTLRPASAVQIIPDDLSPFDRDDTNNIFSASSCLRGKHMTYFFLAYLAPCEITNRYVNVNISPLRICKSAQVRCAWPWYTDPEYRRPRSGTSVSRQRNPAPAYWRNPGGFQSAHFPRGRKRVGRFDFRCSQWVDPPSPLSG